jgi:hypothetical protein
MTIVRGNDLTVHGVEFARWYFDVFATAFFTRTQHKWSGFFWP